MENIKLSDLAAHSLKVAHSDRIGAVIMATEEIRSELREAGVIGANGGLTIKGSALATKLQNAYLDQLFS